MLGLRFLAAILGATLVLSAPSNSSASIASFCGSNPTAEWRAEAEAHFIANKVQGNLTADRPAYAVIQIYYHVVSNSRGQGAIPDNVLGQQLNVLNRIYNNYGVYFQVAQTKRYTRDDWYSNINIDFLTQAEVDMKSNRIGGADALNIYFVGSIRDANGQTGTLGFATFPYQYQSAKYRDGIVYSNTAVPGGTSPNTNTGAVLAHEAGHWLGLFHTFEGGCRDGNNAGDYVADTPAEASAARDCAVRDSCPYSPGNDPVRNHMDYTDDFCRNQFTPGQVSRFQDQSRTYRGIYF
ncbi:hypothetical protein HGRIS_004682 [Hohenbuehelia grisea]|uniref:Peptidase M43 pregnancy-associated plasma-A domain-containing protein n=1 Tax=Hohenbuehelia grisea TaxID=104357 RepID=A0ABR3JCL1_9AGAR